MGRVKISSVFMLLTISLLPMAAYSLAESTNDTTDGEFISKLVTTLAEFCPHQDLARVDNNTGRTDTGSCCKEFFYSNDTDSITKPDLVYAVKPFQKCIFVQSQEPTIRSTVISYYVVVDAPPGGCVAQVNGHDSQTEEDQTLFEPRCDDDVSPWRRLFPVFSKTSALIYKTPHCALCHGVRDLIYWLPKVICEHIPSFTSSMDACDVFFDYPGNHEDVEHLQCFTGVFATCNSDIDDALPSDIGFTKNELNQACHVDALPPFTNLFHSKNLFCYICNYYIIDGYLPIESCVVDTTDSDQNRFGTAAFIGIMDIFSLRDFDEAAPTTEDDAACISFDNEMECHRVMCPLGQTRVRRGKEMVCAFELVKWAGPRFKALLVLTSDQSITVDGTDLKTILTERQLKSPWPREWRISSLSRRVMELSENTTRPGDFYNINEPVSTKAMATDQLLVQLIYMKASFNPKKVLQDVSIAMKKTWTLNFNRERIIFKQSMSRYRLTGVTFLNITDRNFAVPMWHGIRYDPPIGSTPVFEIVEVFQIRSSNYINNMFFCSQVELPASHFTVFRYGYFNLQALYNTTTGYLFDNEFHQLERFIGQSYFRICVDNLITQETSASVSRSSYLPIFEFALIHLLFTVVTHYWLHY